MKISMIVPFYGQWNLTYKFLVSVYQKLVLNEKRYSLELILVDDFTPEKDIDLLSTEGQIDFWKTKGLNVLCHRNPFNRGFGGSNNVGAELATGDILIFTQNDVLIKDNFVPELLSCLDKQPICLVGNRLVDNSGWTKFKVTNKEIIIPYLEGWFLACKRELWKIVRFDEKLYYPYDFEDVDLSMQVQDKGYELVAMNSPKLEHLGGKTIYALVGGRVREITTKKHKQQFYDKWKEKLEKRYV